MFSYLGTGVLPTGSGADIVTAITSGISDNITEILGVLGFMVALKLVFRFFNSATHGKAKV
jgi:hypothetical protein